MTDTTERWATSRDRETFHGDSPTWWEAVIDGLGSDARPDAGIYVGRCVPPMPPEDHDLADVLLEHIGCQDDYRGDWADGWPEVDSEQYNELSVMLAAALAAWLDRHDLRPTWFTVPESEWRTMGEALAAKNPAKPDPQAVAVSALEAVMRFWEDDPQAFGDEATVTSMAGRFAIVADQCREALAVIREQGESEDHAN